MKSTLEQSEKDEDKLFEIQHKYYLEYLKWYVDQGIAVYDNAMAVADGTAEILRRVSIKKECQEDKKKCMIDQMKELYDENSAPNKPEYFAPIEEVMANIVTYYDLHKTYSINLQQFQKSVNKQLQEHRPSLIMRDEAEYFRPHTSPLYNYPYQDRQNLVAPDIPLLITDFDEHQDYMYAQYEINMGFSQTCLEQSLFA